MNQHRVATIVVLALGCVSFLSTTSDARRYRNENSRNYNRNYRSNYNQNRVLIPAGSTVNVRLTSKVSTENGQSGDTWTGTVIRPIVAGNNLVIPAGTPVEGVVTNATQGTHNNRPELALAIRQITVNGRSTTMNAYTEPIVAGSDRAKKLGVIAGGAAAGALLGHTVAKDQHGTLIGGLLGGAASYGLTRHALRTMQLKPGTELTFTTRGDVLAYR